MGLADRYLIARLQVQGAGESRSVSATPSTELGWLTHELRQLVTPCPFRFEWSNKRQGTKLLLGGDWARKATHTTRTIIGTDGAAIRKGISPLSTAERQSALAAGTRLVRAWQEGADTRQRPQSSGQPLNARLAHQRRIAVDFVRQRSCGFGRKRKLLRLSDNLFKWLDERGLTVDSPNSLAWAGDGVRRDTANYADRLFVAQWAAELNGFPWVLPKHRRVQTPKVNRPFVEVTSDTEIERMFPVIRDSHAHAFLRVVAATGCRPSEVAFFDWSRWEEEGRTMSLHGFSPKGKKKFVAVIHPQRWLEGIDISLLLSMKLGDSDRRSSEEMAELNTRQSSRLLKLVQKDLEAAGFSCLPTWTDLRHMWTIRAEADGMDRRTAALAQAHSERMATAVYLRHGEERQVLAGIQRFARLGLSQS
jgi:integrase